MNATLVGKVAAEDALEPLFRWMRTAADSDGPLGVAPGLRATGDGWSTAAELATAPHERLGVLIAEAGRRWEAPPHVAAALWWKHFSYWTVLPVAMGWALNRRLPVLTAETTMLRTPAAEPRMQIAISELRVATGDVDELGTIIGATLLRDLHAPLIDALHALTMTGRRGLWGSVAEALADPLFSFAGDILDDPGAAARTLLESIGEPVADLVDLPALRRRTCCLWVTLPGGDACPTCCVTERRNTGAGA
ncbi:(2Fe-2S)-binding protein [Actinomadura macra]|uniref:(2Fe-2S)-binding protein n=1 Tax=Actinomadura macra TaxID=46164 RepID=UPI0008361FFD|nr:(2Fe-2S)-binding protein [Actinomadura macra]